jgi:superfamily II DNA or RNA helicase
MSDERDVLGLSYTDNDRVTVARRLAAEIDTDASRLWVASGYFAVSVWSALADALGRLDDFRLLLGKDYELTGTDVSKQGAHIADLVRQALVDETAKPRLPARSEAEEVAELIDFLVRHHTDGHEVVKLWGDRDFLHAKAYILAHSVGIGSANFTGSGLTSNRELVGWRQDRSVVEEVAGWFEALWNDEAARGYTDELVSILQASPLVSDAFTPHELLMRVLAARYGLEAPPELDRDASFTLKWFQEDAAFRVIKLLDRRARGALLADAVGLGKTYVALAVIEHYLYLHAGRRRGKGKPVLLIVPASLKGMWSQLIERAGLDWACRLLTTQKLKAEFDVAPYAGADLLVIDEGHRLRGGGVWFRKVIDLVTSGADFEDKRVLLLTATPVNTSMTDLVRQLQVLTKNRRSAWAPDIADFERYLDRVDKGQADPFPILDRCIVRRSRSDILRAQDEARAAGLHIDEVKLPKRQLAHVAYNYGGHDDLFDEFARTLRSLTLAPYDLERFRCGEATDAGPLTLLDAQGHRLDDEDERLTIRPGTLAALCAVGLLVRFQSSLAAIRISLRRLDSVLHRFGEALEHDPPLLLDLKTNREVRRLLGLESREDIDEAEGESDDEACAVTGGAFDSAWDCAFAELEPLAEPGTYDIEAVRHAIANDRAKIAALLDRLPDANGDGKLTALVEALRRPKAQSKKGAPGIEGNRILLFTQFRDTGMYVTDRLREEGFPVARIDGSVATSDRVAITSLFDPATADGVAMEWRARGKIVPQILVSTDVLAEGHNLQLADTVINFDLHFNPQVAVQRAGRIDRIGSPYASVNMVSFLPPEDLNRHIGLLARLDERFRRIHGLGLGDEGVTPLTADQQILTLEQIRRLYADDATVLDEVERTWTLGSTDYMRQPLEAFLARVGRDEIARIPLGVTSVKRLPPDWRQGPGAFIAFHGPAASDGARDTFWRFYRRCEDDTWDGPLSDEVEVFKAIVCRPSEPRAESPWPTEGPTVIDWTLLRRAAEDLASQLTAARATAEVAAGASERSRKLRTQLRASLMGLDVPGAEALLERLRQVRVEDFDGRSGWRTFTDAERALRREKDAARRAGLGVEVVRLGFELFGQPEEGNDEAAAMIVVEAEDLQLVAYEVLAPAPVSTDVRQGERQQERLQV